MSIQEQISKQRDLHQLAITMLDKLQASYILNDALEDELFIKSINKELSEYKDLIEKIHNTQTIRFQAFYKPEKEMA